VAATTARARTSRGTRSTRSSSFGAGISSPGCEGPARSTSSRRCSGWSTYSRSNRSGDSARYYRRGAFESAALDLALRQSGLSLQDAVGRPARPVNFVASSRIGDPPSLGPLHALLVADSALRFKLDATPSWDDDLVGELARLGCVDVLDMKGWYRNVNVATNPEAGPLPPRDQGTT
jgi:hypothetical protein